MKPTIHKYKIGERVLLGGREAFIEGVGVSINRLPVYRIGGVWHFERELTECYPPCPL